MRKIKPRMPQCWIAIAVRRPARFFFKTSDSRELEEFTAEHGWTELFGLKRGLGRMPGMPLERAWSPLRGLEGARWYVGTPGM